jgi:hypothetical protein
MDDLSLRVSDADREQAVVALREHLLAGRLTLEEFTARVEVALRARLGEELSRAQDDLPEVFFETASARRRPARFTTALLGQVARRGRLRLRGWAIAGSVFGDLDFDLREATVDQPRTLTSMSAESLSSATAGIGAAMWAARTPPPFTFAYSASPAQSMYGGCRTICAIAAIARSSANFILGPSRTPSP